VSVACGASGVRAPGGGKTGKVNAVRSNKGLWRRKVDYPQRSPDEDQGGPPRDLLFHPARRSVADAGKGAEALAAAGGPQPGSLAASMFR
jgi:hypothetical protein